METIHYKDVQRIDLGLILFFAITSLSAMIYLWSKKVDSENPTSPIIVAIVLVCINVFLASIKLTIEIKDGKFYYKLFPFHLRVRKIDVNNIDSVSVEKFNPLYWGLGLRYDILRNVKGYIVRGSTGLKIVLRGGKKILFSTPNAMRFTELIKLSNS